jgi:hypothetical protein
VGLPKLDKQLYLSIYVGPFIMRKMYNDQNSLLIININNYIYNYVFIETTHSPENTQLFHDIKILSNVLHQHGMWFFVATHGLIASITKVFICLDLEAPEEILGWTMTHPTPSPAHGPHLVQKPLPILRQRLFEA